MRNFLRFRYITLFLLCFPLFGANKPGVGNLVTIIVDILGLLFLAVTFVTAWNIYSNYKEGELAIPWGFLAAGIVFFFLGRILQAGETSGYWPMPPELTSFVHFIVALSLAIGMLLYKKRIM